MSTFKNWEYEVLTEEDYYRVSVEAATKRRDELHRQMSASRMVLYAMVGGGPLGKSVQSFCEYHTGDLYRFDAIVPMRHQPAAIEQYCKLLRVVAKAADYDLILKPPLGANDWIFPGDDWLKDIPSAQKVMSFYKPITIDNLWQAQIILYTLVGGGVLGQTALYQPEDFYIDDRADTPGMKNDCEVFCKRYAEVCKTLDTIPTRWPIFGGGVFT